MVYETDGKEPVVTGLSLFSGGAIGEVVFKQNCVVRILKVEEMADG
jgi:hypothetical protein